MTIFKLTGLTLILSSGLLSVLLLYLIKNQLTTEPGKNKEEVHVFSLPDRNQKLVFQVGHGFYKDAYPGMFLPYRAIRSGNGRVKKNNGSRPLTLEERRTNNKILREKLRHFKLLLDTLKKPTDLDYPSEKDQ